MCNIGESLDPIVPGSSLDDFIRISEIPSEVTIVLGHLGKYIHICAEKKRICDGEDNVVTCFHDICNRCHSKETQLGSNIESSLGSFVALFFSGQIHSPQTGTTIYLMEDQEVRVLFQVRGILNKSYEEVFPATFSKKCAHVHKDTLERYRRVEFDITKITSSEFRENLSSFKLL